MIDVPVKASKHRHDDLWHDDDGRLRVLISPGSAIAAAQMRSKNTRPLHKLPNAPILLDAMAFLMPCILRVLIEHLGSAPFHRIVVSKQREAAPFISGSAISLSRRASPDDEEAL